MDNSYYDRRRFIGQSSAAMGGLALTEFSSPLSIFAQNGNYTKPIRLGLVGIGRRGSRHLDVALGMEGVLVPVIWSPCVQKRKCYTSIQINTNE